MTPTTLGRRALVAAMAVALVAGPATAGADGARRPACVDGAAGLGDAYYPTYGNGGYDVGRYDLDLTYDPATDVLAGDATIRARATERLCRFDLDLHGLEVRSVTVDGQRASWARTGDELVVTPRRPLADGRRFRVEVAYDGVPREFTLPGSDFRTGFMTTPDGATVAGQPEVASSWFPANDHPLDKASYTFEVTVPEAYEVVANGRPRRPRSHRGWTTYRWDAGQPMASYLATIDIGRWDVTRGGTDTGLPVLDAVDPAITGGLRAEVDSSLARQGEVLGLLEGAFGPYPFDTVGAIVDGQDDLFFALETQTRPVYSKLFWLDADDQPINGDGVVVHELAHQWFGDDVALARWQDIWLNEGFATYAEFLWEEHEGRATPAEVFRTLYEGIGADDPFWSIAIGDPGIDNLFAEPVYVRGGMTVEALRQEVGDEAFRAIVRGWTERFGGGNGTTDDFVALAEEVSGRQLDALFDAWLFSTTKPALTAAGTDAMAAAAAPGGDAAVAPQAATATTWLDTFRARRPLHGPAGH